MLLSQDAARLPLGPTVRTTLGVKGPRPLVGTWDTKDRVECFAAVSVVTGQGTTRLLAQPARSTAKPGQSNHQRRQAVCAAHLGDSARAYPGSGSPKDIVTIAKAPWQRGAGVAHV